jgi:uncharacterized repeat protein (TIGR01451 family)
MISVLHFLNKFFCRTRAITRRISVILALFCLAAPAFVFAGTPPAPGDIIFNEYAADNFSGSNDFVELLVLTDGLDLRGLRISDNEFVGGVLNNGEAVFVFGNNPYLDNVPRGTLIVVWTVTTGITTDVVVNPAANDWNLVLAPGTGVTAVTDGLGGSINTGFSNSGEAFYLYLPGPDGNSSGMDNIYLDFISSEGGASAPPGLANIDLPSLSDNAYYTGNTAAGNDVVANWVRYDIVPNTATSIGEPNPGQDLSALRTVGVSLPNLSIALSDAPDPIVSGNLLTYTLTVSNIGLAAATAVAVQFTLPAAGVSYSASTTAGGFSASVSAGVVSFTGGSIAAGASVALGVQVVVNTPGTLTSGSAVVDPGNAISESNEGNNTASAVSTTVNAGLSPVIQENTASDFVNLPASGGGALSGVIGDPTDPGATIGLDFSISDADTPTGNLTVTVTSGNLGVVPSANLALSGGGASRNLKITPAAAGYASIVVTVSDGFNNASYTINYAASLPALTPASTRFHTGSSDASTAIALDANYMLVADDENQLLRIYDRAHSGLPLNSFNFSSSLNLPDPGNPEVDIEASVQVGARIFWLGSHSNSANSGGLRPNRYRLFSTDLSGAGVGAALTYVGRYDGLRADLINWDVSNGHGLGANFFGLAAAATAGVIPEAPDGSGFNLEGLTIAPDGSTGYVAFRAPIVPTAARTKALIVPVTNFLTLTTGNPAAGPALFGAPIQLDLGGRGIREIKRNAGGQYLIMAGPPDSDTGTPPKDFRLYTWTGNPADAPLPRTANLTALDAKGSFESVVQLPNPLTSASVLQVLADNGDAIYYNDGTIAKELPQNNHKKFRSDLVVLGELDCPPYAITCPTSVADLSGNTNCQAFLADYTGLVNVSGGCLPGGAPTISQTPAPGAVFNPGRVAVTITTVNAAGQTASCIVNVSINGSCH